MILLKIKIKKILQKHYELAEKNNQLRVHRNEQLQFKYRVNVPISQFSTSQILTAVVYFPNLGKIQLPLHLVMFLLD